MTPEEQERARIVEWLEEKASRCTDYGSGLAHRNAYRIAIKAIERLDHLQEKKG